MTQPYELNAASLAFLALYEELSVLIYEKKKRNDKALRIRRHKCFKEHLLFAISVESIERAKCFPSANPLCCFCLLCGHSRSP